MATTGRMPRGVPGMVAVSVLSRTTALQCVQVRSRQNLMPIVLSAVRIALMAWAGTARFAPSRQERYQCVRHLYP